MDNYAPQAEAQAQGLDQGDLIREARERFGLAAAVDRANRDEAREDLEFLAGSQWHDKDVQERKRDRRPTLTINRLPQFLKQVVNEVRRNRPAIQVVAADGAANPGTAQVFEGLIRAIERVSQASRVYSRALEQAAGCGMGHFRLTLEYEDDESFDMGLRLRSIRNPFSVLWDPNSERDDKADANYAFVYREMSRDEFKAAYPNASLQSWDIGASKGASAGSGIGWRHDTKTTTVCEYWLVKEEPGILVKLVQDQPWLDQQSGMMIQPTGEEVTLSTPTEMELQEALMQGFTVVNMRKTKARKVCMYLLGGNQVLEGPIEWPGTRIPLWTVVGDEIDMGEGVQRSSLVRAAKDPQRMLNYYASADAEMIALAPKAPFILSRRQVEGHEAYWQTANQSPRPFLLYNDMDKDGPITAPRPQREPGVGTNPGLMAGQQAASQYLKDTTGIYDASLGNRSNETSGKAIEARDAQSDTGTFNYIDNLALQVESCGREMVEVIPYVYSPQRQLRILGPDDKEAIVDLAAQGHDLSVGKYDVHVKLGPAFETQRQEMLAGLIDLAKNAGHPAFQVLLYGKIARLQDFHGSEDLADDIERVAIQLGLLPPPPGSAPPMMPGAPPQLPPPAGGAPPGMPPGMPPMGMSPPNSPAGAPAPGARVGPRPPIPAPQGSRGL